MGAGEAHTQQVPVHLGTYTLTLKELEGGKGYYSGMPEMRPSCETAPARTHVAAPKTFSSSIRAPITHDLTKKVEPYPITTNSNCDRGYGRKFACASTRPDNRRARRKQRLQLLRGAGCTSIRTKRDQHTLVLLHRKHTAAVEEHTAHRFSKQQSRNNPTAAATGVLSSKRISHDIRKLSSPKKQQPFCSADFLTPKFYDIQM